MILREMMIFLFVVAISAACCPEHQRSLREFSALESSVDELLGENQKLRLRIESMSFDFDVLKSMLNSLQRQQELQWKSIENDRESVRRQHEVQWQCIGKLLVGHPINMSSCSLRE